MATIVAFHAHPDDEVLLTGGTIARLAAEGHRVVVVVACDGDVKDGPEQGRRLEELRASAAILGADRAVHLGYADSGHGPVLYEDPPGRTRFARADVEEAAGRLAALLAEEHADLLLSYDPHGGYGHRDHVRLASWCRRWLGAPPAAQLFEAGYLSTVKGLRLADGREVVIKVRPRMSRLAGCAVVHRALWTAGFPCPEPLVDVQPLDGYAATAEALVLDAGEPPPDSELAALSAAALARLVELGPDPGAVPSLAPSPSWTGWDHAEPGLWPTSEELDVDLNAYPEPQWLARVAAAVRDPPAARTFLN